MFSVLRLIAFYAIIAKTQSTEQLLAIEAKEWLGNLQFSTDTDEICKDVMYRKVTSLDNVDSNTAGGDILFYIDEICDDLKNCPIHTNYEPIVIIGTSDTKHIQIINNDGDGDYISQISVINRDHSTVFCENSHMNGIRRTEYVRKNDKRMIVYTLKSKEEVNSHEWYALPHDIDEEQCISFGNEITTRCRDILQIDNYSPPLRFPEHVFVATDDDLVNGLNAVQKYMYRISHGSAQPDKFCVDTGCYSAEKQQFF